MLPQRSWRLARFFQAPLPALWYVRSATASPARQCAAPATEVAEVLPALAALSLLCVLEDLLSAADHAPIFAARSLRISSTLPAD